MLRLGSEGLRRITPRGGLRVAEIKSKSLTYLLLWVVVVFNGLFFWLMFQPATSPRVDAPPPAKAAPMEKEPTRYEFHQTHMGSEFKLVLYCADAPTARSASDAAFARIAQLDAELSDYNPESE